MDNAVLFASCLHHLSWLSPSDSPHCLNHCQAALPPRLHTLYQNSCSGLHQLTTKLRAMQSCGGCGTAKRASVQFCGAGDVTGRHGSPGPPYLHCCRNSAAHSGHPGSTACHLTRPTPGQPSIVSVCASGCVPGCCTVETLQLLCVCPQELLPPPQGLLAGILHAPLGLSPSEHQPAYLSVCHRCSEPAAGFTTLPQQLGYPTLLCVCPCPLSQLSSLQHCKNRSSFCCFSSHITCTVCAPSLHVTVFAGMFYKDCVWSCVYVYHSPHL